MFAFSLFFLIGSTLERTLLMLERLWDFFVDTMVALFMPLVCSYFTLTANPFLNISIRDATGFERAGNILLSPVQYLLAGREAIQKPDGSWEFVQRFDYSHGFWIKATSSFLALPSSLLLGSAVKGLSYVQKTTRKRHASLLVALHSKEIHSNTALYEKLGMCIDSSLQTLIPQGHQRRPGDEKALRAEKEGLRDIAAILNEANIIWWVDCGTCLGAYRYGGVIPWDGDIDIAVLKPDFQNVRHALNRLDPQKYIVQDWSTRDHPNSYIKVYIRESATLIDIYHFAIDTEKRQLQYIFSLGSNLFFPEWWKVRERRFEVPVAFETVFPLKKGQLDGVIVNVPNDTKKYLQRYYGENLEPAKIYNKETDQYEKDPSHPYWQRAFVH